MLIQFIDVLASNHISLFSLHLTQTHLKHAFIQQARPEHCDTIGADPRILNSEKVQGVHLLTVQVQSHRLTLNTVGNSVPPGDNEGKESYFITYGISL